MRVGGNDNGVSGEGYHSPLAPRADGNSHRQRGPRPLRVVFLLAWLGLFSQRASVAQSVSGQAQDEATDAPIRGVTVTLLDAGGVAIDQQTTEDDGRFALAAPRPGKYRLRFQVPGYRMLVTPLLELRAAEDFNYPLKLRPVAPYALDTLLVEGRPVSQRLAGFYRRREQISWGTFFTREEFMRFRPVTVTDILRRTRQILVLPNTDSGTGSRLVGRYSQRGLCSPILAVDGVTVGPAWDLDQFPADAVEAVEVYGAGTGLPRGFWLTGSDCGLVAIWTRPAAGGRTTHLALGAHAGTAVAGVSGGRGRVGLQASVGLGGLLEGYLAFSSILSALDPKAVLPRSGWEIMGALRGRPLGRETAWYVGLGARAGGLRETGSAPSSDEQHLVVLSGLELTVGRILPFVELRLLGPLGSGSAMVTGFLGASARIY